MYYEKIVAPERHANAEKGTPVFHNMGSFTHETHKLPMMNLPMFAP